MSSTSDPVSCRSCGEPAEAAGLCVTCAGRLKEPVPNDLAGLPVAGPAIAYAGGGWIVRLLFTSPRLAKLGKAGWRLSPVGDWTQVRRP